MSLSNRHISLALVDHLENMILWNATSLYLKYCWQIWVEPQKTSTKVYFMLMQVTQYK